MGLIFWEATSLPTEQNQTHANVVSSLSVKACTLICLSDLFHWEIKGAVLQFLEPSGDCKMNYSCSKTKGSLEEHLMLL